MFQLIAAFEDRDEQSTGLRGSWGRLRASAALRRRYGWLRGSGWARRTTRAGERDRTSTATRARDEHRACPGLARSRHRRDAGNFARNRSAAPVGSSGRSYCARTRRIPLHRSETSTAVEAAGAMHLRPRRRENRRDARHHVSCPTANLSAAIGFPGAILALQATPVTNVALLVLCRRGFSGLNCRGSGGAAAS